MIQLVLNENEVTTRLPAGLSLLEFLRTHKRLTGTKIGCKEGDCGACTVLVGECIEGKIRYRTAASCIMPLANANGKHINFIDDIPMREGTLHAVVYGSPVAHAKVINLDVSKAEKAEGVVAVFTAKDVTGHNQIGDILPDKPLFAEDKVTDNGMPVAVIVAETESLARRALDKIEMKFEELPVITEPREAFDKNELIMNSRTFSIGDTESVWNKCEYLFSGSAKMDGQEHLYLETQGAYVYPTEAGNLKVFSSTQGALYVQLAISEVLGLPMNRIEVDVRRLGGGFGGKEAQANTWATLTALAAYHLDRPVKLILDRADDLRMTGKRHPYEFDYQNK